ncbi:MAG: DUF3267 domain-containing protein [Bacteroidota bacterium]
MKIEPEELTAKGYELLDKLDHRALIPFVQLYLAKPTRFSVLWFAFCGIGMAESAFCFIWCMRRHVPGFNMPTAMAWTFAGFILALGLIPVHECIHALAYRAVGAKHTSFDSNLKKFYFLAIADRFVANRREFQIVALAPFVCISMALTALLFVLPPAGLLMVSAAFLTHTALCSGDFGLLSYFDFHKDSNIVTYDDKENKLSYFYRLRVQNEL